MDVPKICSLSQVTKGSHFEKVLESHFWVPDMKLLILS